MKLFASIAVIGNKVKDDKVSAFAAEASLFIIMSIVPIILLLMTLIKYTPLTETALINFIREFAPAAFVSGLTSIINEMYSNVSGALIAVTIVSILWAAGKGFVSLIDGLNAVFNIKEHRNWIVLRLYSILYTIVFIVIIAICLTIYILGNQISGLITSRFPAAANVFNVLINFRWVITIVMFTIFFTFLYVAIPNRHTRIKRQLPGALFSSIGWAGFSFFFSLYVNYSKNLSMMYGSLATIVCAMLWLYVCMYIFLIGAEINLYFEQWTSGSAVEQATDITHHKRP